MIERIKGYDRVPRRSWLSDASGHTIVCLYQLAICPHKKGLAYFFLLFSLLSLGCPLSPKISLTETVISSASKDLY